MLEGWRMRSAGYDVFRGVKGAAGAPGTVEVERVCTALNSAPYGSSPFVAIRAPAYTSLMPAGCAQAGPACRRTMLQYDKM